MIDKPGKVFRHVAVQIPFLVQIKNVRISFQEPTFGFLFGDLLPDIFDNVGAFPDRATGKESVTVDRRRSNFQILALYSRPTHNVNV